MTEQFWKSNNIYIYYIALKIRACQKVLGDNLFFREKTG